MKPKIIVLVRHGESEGNANKEIYKSIPDYALYLTNKGKLQALGAGQRIREIFQEYKDTQSLWKKFTNFIRGRSGLTIKFYVSTFFRTRQTFQGIMKSFPELENPDVYFDPRLREQEWNGKMPYDGFRERDEVERDAYGHFYYRFDGGESCADVYDRVSDIMNTVHRDFEKPNFPEFCVFVGHGMTNRVILMRWFHLSVEDFELLGNPKNCECIVLKLNEKTGKYDCVSNLRKYEKRGHNFQFDPSKFDKDLQDDIGNLTFRV